MDWINILLCIIAWAALGYMILGCIDRNLEILTWKKNAVWWLNILVDLFWPIVAVFYLTKK